MLTGLRLQRLLVGISEEELAELAGVERTRLSRAENGHLHLRADELGRLEAALAIAAVEATIYPGLNPNLEQT